MRSNDSYRLQADRGAAAFLSDIATGLRMVDVWRAFAWDEMQQRYQRSMLGVLWIIVSYIIFVGGVSIFFSAFATADPGAYLVYVAIGYAAFTFLIGNVTDGCQVFIGSATWIKSVALPYSIHVYRSIFRSIFTFALQSIVALAILLMTGWTPGLITLMILPALAIYLVNAVAVQYLAGLVCARYRDMTHLISSITRLLIFVTPILWVREERTGPRAAFADLNPLTHFIEILRAPLMGTEPRLLSWGVVIGLTVLAWLTATLVAARVRRRLAYWV